MLLGNGFTVSFLLPAGSRMMPALKITQTRGKILYSPISVNSLSPASDPFQRWLFIFALCSKVLWQRRNKESFHNLSWPLDTREPAVAIDSVDTLVRGVKIRETLTLSSLKISDFPSKYRMCLCCSFAQCSSAQRLCGASQSTEQRCYPAKTLLPEKRKPIPSISMSVWTRKMRFGTWAMTPFIIKNIKVSVQLESGLFQIQMTFPELNSPGPGGKGGRDLESGEVIHGTLSNSEAALARNQWGALGPAGPRWVAESRDQSSWAQESVGNEIWSCLKTRVEWTNRDFELKKIKNF